jgi:DnaJ-class molecular chaperone
MIPNYYEVLGVSKDSSKDQIKKAYRQLALQWHPDVNHSPDAHERFIEINQAYLILSDDEARARYDFEYDLYSAEPEIFGQSTWHKEKTTESPKSESANKEYPFSDQDLNGWTRTAKAQAERYASMSFSDFSKLVGEIIIETGKQGANAVLCPMEYIMAIYPK